MALYTERHGMRKAIERTSIISIKVYSLLLDCCEKYYDNIAWKFTKYCPDGCGCCGLDYKKFYDNMEFDIPTIYRDSHGRIDKPDDDPFGNNEYDQYALLDLIEFIGQNSRDIKIESFHSYFGHNHIELLTTIKVRIAFRNDINDIFQKTGLLFTMTDKMTIERVFEYDVLSPQIENIVASVPESGIRDLLNYAIHLFRQPSPSMRNDSVEKLWDAFERLKTYYCTLDKKGSANKIIADMSSGQTEFTKLFEDEFKTLTTIGNDFRIRHHETSKIDITDDRHFDYLFNRCMSLIASALQYLK